MGKEGTTVRKRVVESLVVLVLVLGVVVVLVLVVHPQCTHLRKEGNLGTDGTDETRELGDNGCECFMARMFQGISDRSLAR